MAQANHNIHQFDRHPKRETTVWRKSEARRLTISQHIAMATMTHAMQLARGAVKEHLKRQRVRLADVEAKEISSWALVYLDDHPELFIDQARPVIESWFARGVFGKRAQKEFIKHLQIEQSQADRSVANG
jgi:hypothetical protein